MNNTQLTTIGGQNLLRKMQIKEKENLHSPSRSLKVTLKAGR